VHRQLVRKEADAHAIEVDPIVRLHYVEVREPDLADPSGDLQRLLEALERDWALTGFTAEPQVLATLQRALREGGWTATVAVHDGETITAIWPGFHDTALGIAFDVGSTTVAGHLCDLASGEVLASAGAMNPQIRFGEDLMSRVSYVMMHPGAERDLTAAVRECVDGLIGELCEAADADRTDVLDLTVVGNPIMHHLFLGLDPTELGGAPFALATDEAGKQISFLAGSTADYCDFISHPRQRAEFVEGVFGELARLQPPILRLANLPADSATTLTLKGAAEKHGYLLFSRPAYRCAQIRLGSPAARQQLKESALKRKAFRSCLRALEKAGPVTVDHITQWNSISANLPRFVEAHVARFRVGGRTSNLSSAERQNFLSGLAELLSGAGWLVLTRLLAGDEPVAWNYGFQFAGSWFYYQPTFDARWRQLSPGFCLLTKMVEQACDNPDIHLLDLGLGEEEYKDRFAGAYRQTLHVTITDSRAVRLRETVRYHAAAAVKSSPRLEHWVRRLVGRASAENAKL
jgi:CelD/BcsL family acetyltransferase involved in cellulose biosynthesis